MFAGCSHWPDLPADILAACTPTHFKFGSFSARAPLSLAVTDSTAYCIWPGFQAHKNALSLAFLRKVQCYSGPARARVPPTPRTLVSNRSWDVPLLLDRVGGMLTPPIVEKNCKIGLKLFTNRKLILRGRLKNARNVCGGRAREKMTHFSQKIPTNILKQIRHF